MFGLRNKCIRIVDHNLNSRLDKIIDFTLKTYNKEIPNYNFKIPF